MSEYRILTETKLTHKKLFCLLILVIKSYIKLKINFNSHLLFN